MMYYDINHYKNDTSAAIYSNCQAALYIFPDLLLVLFFFSVKPVFPKLKLQWLCLKGEGGSFLGGYSLLTETGYFM